jgi:hypothetical protein
MKNAILGLSIFFFVAAQPINAAVYEFEASLTDSHYFSNNYCFDCPFPDDQEYSEGEIGSIGESILVTLNYDNAYDSYGGYYAMDITINLGGRNYSFYNTYDPETSYVEAYLSNGNTQDTLTILFTEKYDTDPSNGYNRTFKIKFTDYTGTAFNGRELPGELDLDAFSTISIEYNRDDWFYADLYGYEYSEHIYASEPANNDIRLTSLSFSQPSVTAGDRAYGTVTLNKPAPSGGFKVSLRSSNPNVASVPNTLLIPAGANSSRFAVTTNADICSTSVDISAANAMTSFSEPLYVESDYSASPSQPTGLDKFLLKNRLILNWDSMPNVDNFVIDRQRTGQAWVNIAEVPGNRTSFIPPQQRPCVAYRYRLRAVNHCGRSAPAYIGHRDIYGDCPF